MKLQTSLRLLASAIAVALLACRDSGPKGALDGHRLSVGESTACVLGTDGAVSCWGRNAENLEYGVSPTTVPASPTPVAVPIPRLVSLSGGASQHMCGLLPTGGAICWGRGGQGQLGNGALGFVGNAPMNVLSSADWAEIRVGRLLGCGLTTAGDAMCWGLNQRGELARAKYPDTLVAPAKVSGGITFAMVVPGWTHTCGISTAGGVYCWGDNTFGQLGIGTADTTVHPQPLPVPYPAAFKTIRLGARSTCAITTDDRAVCWGYNGTGQLGDGTTTQRNEPTLVGGDLKFMDISLGSGFAGGVRPEIPLVSTVQGGNAHACAVTQARTVYCWGWNGAGQVGDGTNVTRLLPVQVQGVSGARSIALGGGYSCATTDAEIRCWGSNYYGQLGNNSPIDSRQPVTVNYTWR